MQVNFASVYYQRLNQTHTDMKKLFLLTWICLSLQACVIDETLDNIVPKSSDNVSIRYVQNTMIVDLGDATADIYSYNGEGATFIKEADTPTLLYEPTTIPWENSGFTYAYAEAVKKTDWQKNLEYHEAFATIAFIITNKEKSLHLEVRNIELCNIATDGIFHFPKYSTNVGWDINTQDGSLSLQTDTCTIEHGDSVILSKTKRLPVIPQTTNRWLSNSLPQKGVGSYILLDCRIFNISGEQQGYQPDKDNPIWSDEEGGFAKLAIPIKLDIKTGVNYTVHLSLESNCPWYNIEGTVPQKILRPIVFSPTVEGWKDGDDINITT